MDQEQLYDSLELQVKSLPDQDGEPQVQVKSSDCNREHKARPKVNFPIRYLMSFLAFLGCANSYFIRSNFSIAIVDMVSKHNVSTGNGTFEIHQDFFWDTKTQGIVLSSFFWGYAAMQIPSGLISSKFGGQKTFGIGLLIPAILTLLTPIVAKMGGYWWVVVLRVLEGVFQAFTFPAIADFWSKWAPIMERTKLVCMSTTGAATGTLISMPVCGLLAAYYSWEAIFYVSGACSVVWTVIWFIFSSATPESNRFMSEAERRYIVSTRGAEVSIPVPFRQVPWKRIFTSVPLFALCVAQFCTSWGISTVMTELPTYMKQVLKFDIANTGFTSALPYLAVNVVQIIASNVVDALRKRRIVSTTNIRRACAVVGLCGAATFTLLTGFTGSPVVSVAYFTLAVGFCGLTGTCLDVNIIDLAPNLSAILMGLINGIGNVPGMVTPVLTGFIVRNKIVDEWRIVFYICSSIYAVGAFVFGVFGSGEVQSWNYDPQ